MHRYQARMALFIQQVLLELCQYRQSILLFFFSKRSPTPLFDSQVHFSQICDTGHIIGM